MNKSMVVGIVAGIGVATAGGVAGYTYLDKQAEGEELQQIAVRATPKQECWDEEVVVQVDPRDQNRIAGTAAGAVVGGAIGKDVGDRDLTTAVGAAAGAYIGRRIQGEIQENRADDRAVTTIERRCGPAGSRPAGSR